MFPMDGLCHFDVSVLASNDNITTLRALMNTPSQSDIIGENFQEMINIATYKLQIETIKLLIEYSNEKLYNTENYLLRPTLIILAQNSPISAQIISIFREYCSIDLASSALTCIDAHYYTDYNTLLDTILPCDGIDLVQLCSIYIYNDDITGIMQTLDKLRGHIIYDIIIKNMLKLASNYASINASKILIDLILASNIKFHEEDLDHIRHNVSLNRCKEILIIIKAKIAVNSRYNSVIKSIEADFIIY
jgi:hypothetical protein